MTMFKQIIENILLTESVSVDDVTDAIDNHRRVIINYHTDGKDDATGPRVCEIYAYGLTKAGNPVIRTFQPYGDTTSKIPAWKFMRLDRISGWKPTNQIFSRPASFYYHGLGDFNPNGDETMSVVYKIADFNDNSNNQQTQIKTSYSGPKLKQVNNNPSDEVYKTDTERNMERLRQQLDNPITLSDLKLQNGFNGVKDNKIEAGPKLKNNKANNNDELSNLSKKLGDTSKPISFSDLNKRLLSNDNNPSDEVYKTDTERNMERLRQQLDNPRKIDLDKIPKK